MIKIRRKCILLYDSKSFVIMSSFQGRKYILKYVTTLPTVPYVSNSASKIEERQGVRIFLKTKS
jgi:hypothetical protein